MSILDDIVNSTKSGLAGTDKTFIDADTLVGKDGTKYRIQGIDAPEVEKIVGGQYKLGTAGGEAATDTLRSLANTEGFTNIVPVLDEDGNPALDPYGRQLVDLKNDKGESFKTKVLQSGVLGANKYTNETDRVTSRIGQLRREQANLEGTSTDTAWDEARNRLEQAMLNEGHNQRGFRQTALNEAELAAAKATGQAHRYATDNVQIRSFDRTIDNKSLNPLSDSFEQGWIGAKEASYGTINLIGETTGNEWLADIGEAGVSRARSTLQDYGTTLTDWQDIQPSWTDVGGTFDRTIQYISNNAALSLPYMAITASGAALGGLGVVPAAIGFSAPAAVYTGQVWNEQEGDHKDAAIAIGSGVAQATLDRLGLNFLFAKGVGGRELLKKATNELIKDGASPEEAAKRVANATRKELAGFAGDVAAIANRQIEAKNIFKNLAKRAVVGTAGEAGTEGLQEAIGYIGAHHQDVGTEAFDFEELNRRMLAGIIAGGTLGGLFSVPGSAYDAGAWADIAVRQAPADVNRQSLPTKFAEEEKENFGRVASIQEHTAQTRARAAAAGPNAHPTIEERTADHKKARKERTVTDTIVDTLHAAPALWQGATRYIFNTELLEKSRSARILADMFGGQLQRTFSGSNYENQKHHIVTIYRNLLPQPKEFWAARGLKAGPTGLVSRKRAAEESVKIYRQLNAAIDPKTKELDWEKVPEDIKPFVTQLLQLGDRMHADQKRFNEDLGYQKNYLLRYKSFDKNKINNNKNEFAGKLMEHFGFSRADAMELVHKITDSSEVNDFSDILEGAGAAGRPGAHKERSLNLSEHADFQQFMEQNLFANVANAAKSAARYQAYQEFVGDNHSVLNQLLADMQAEGVHPDEVNKVASQMQDYLAAESGNYKRAQSEMGKKLERIQRSLMTWMTVAGLPLATISSFVEVALTTKGLTKSDIFGKTGLEAQGTELGKQIWNLMGKSLEYDEKLDDQPPAIQGQNVLDKLGYTNWDVGSASTTSTATRVGATEVADTKTAFLENYFIATGLTGWTNFTRRVRASFAGDYLMSKLDLIANSDPENKTNEVQEAEEHLRNYGINVDDAVNAYLTGQPMPEAELREFMFNWINDAVVLPQSANRPLIYQDPRFALFTQFQGFISAFTANQIPKMWGDYVKRGTPAMKYNAFATMATMIALGFASQYLKDLIKHAKPIAPGEHPWLDDPEYIQRGIRSSGLLGTGERVLDQFFPIYETRSSGTGEWLFNTTTGESPALGFAKRAVSGVGALTQGDVGKFSKEAVRLTPLGPLNFVRDAAGETFSAWNFKGD